MKRILLIISIVLIVLGVVGRFVAAQMEYVTEEGMLVESGLTPLSALVLVLGVLLLIIWAMIALIGWIVRLIKKRRG